jgi:hypothetical protein
MNLIESRPDVMMGQPVVAGTRITVEDPTAPTWNSRKKKRQNFRKWMGT